MQKSGELRVHVIAHPPANAQWLQVSSILMGMKTKYVQRQKRLSRSIDQLCYYPALNKEFSWAILTTYIFDEAKIANHGLNFIDMLYYKSLRQ
jgi:hypothetical protein